MARKSNGEGSVYLRGDGEWVAAVTLPNGMRKTLYAKTKAAASKRLRDALSALDKGVRPADGRITVATVLTTWLTDVVAHTVRPKTFIRYKEVVGLHLVPSLGKLRLIALQPAHIDHYISEKLAAGCSPRSVHHHRAVLRVALNRAIKQGLIALNAAALVDPPHVPEREAHAITFKEARALLAAIKGDRLEALFTVALALGLRQSEALALKWSDLDLEEGTLAVQRVIQRVEGQYVFAEPKTRRSRRVIPLPSPVIAALKGHRTRQLEERLRAGNAWQGEQWSLVFCTAYGEPLSAFQARRRFQELLARAGIGLMRYHDLRHGAASLMAAAGVPMRVAMELMGHSSISVTANIYQHVAAEAQKEATEKVAAAIWG